LRLNYFRSFFFVATETNRAVSCMKQYPAFEPRNVTSCALIERWFTRGVYIYYFVKRGHLVSEVNQCHFTFITEEHYLV
jgi:hypothetical protein